MKLHEIISANENPIQTFLIEALLPYRKQLRTFYTNEFNCQPVLMVTDVMNAVQYAKIVPAEEFNEAIDDYLSETELTDEDKEIEKEVINFNSAML